MELMLAAAAFAWVFSTFTADTFNEKPQQNQQNQQKKKPSFTATLEIYQSEAKKDR